MSLYKQLKEHEAGPGLKVVYHSIIGTDRNCKETEITSEVWTLGNSSCVRVKGVSGGVFIESLELQSHYDKRKKKKR